MANRYWVGNGGDANGTTHWSASSGGVGGASIPTKNDNVFFDANSFSLPSQIVTFTPGPNYLYAFFFKNFDASAVTNGPTFDTGTLGSVNWYGYGNITLSSNITKIYGSVYAISIQLFEGATPEARTIDFAGFSNFVNCGFDLGWYGTATVGTTWTLLSDLNIGKYSFYVESGIFDAAGYNVTCGAFGQPDFNQIYTDNATINMGSGTWTIAAPAVDGGPKIQLIGQTLNADTSTLIIDATDSVSIYYTYDGLIKTAAANDVDGRDYTFYNVQILGSGKEIGLVQLGSNSLTFNDLEITEPITLKFTAGSTYIITETPDMNGTAGNLITLASISPGSQWYLATPEMEVEYVAVKDSDSLNEITDTTGGVDNGNNDNWVFSNGGGGTTSNLGGIGVPFGDIMTASTNETNYSIAKATDYNHDTSFWKTRAFPMMLPGYVAHIDKIQVATTQINTAEGAVETTLRYNQNSGTQELTTIDNTGNPRFHKILNKSQKLEDFLLDMRFSNIVTGEETLGDELINNGTFTGNADGWEDPNAV